MPKTPGERFNALPVSDEEKVGEVIEDTVRSEIAQALTWDSSFPGNLQIY